MNTKTYLVTWNRGSRTIQCRSVKVNAKDAFSACRLVAERYGWKTIGDRLVDCDTNGLISCEVYASKPNKGTGYFLRATAI